MRQRVALVLQAGHRDAVIRAVIAVYEKRDFPALLFSFASGVVQNPLSSDRRLFLPSVAHAVSPTALVLSVKRSFNLSALKQWRA